LHSPPSRPAKEKPELRARAFSLSFLARPTCEVFRLRPNEARFHVEAGRAVVAAEHVAPAAAVWVQQVEERPSVFAAVLELAGSSAQAAAQVAIPVEVPPLASAVEPVERQELAGFLVRVVPGWSACSPGVSPGVVQLWAAVVLPEPAELPASPLAWGVPQE
jgi:hypothetical protein